MTTRFMFVVLAVALAAALALPAGAQVTYPVRDVTLVVQAAPGGASDYVSRLVATQVAPILGVRINVVNRVGGGGAVGMGVVKASRPDGYTIGYVPVELAMLKHLGLADLHPDDFDLIMRANVLPAGLTVHADSPYRTVADFVAAARARPGELTVGNSGPGSIWHVAAASMERATGIRVRHVPFDGAAPAVTALLGDRLAAVTVSPSEVLPHVEAGRLRTLAVMAEQRFSMMLGVPTFKEAGHNVVVMAWGGFAMPKNTPAEIRDIVFRAFRRGYTTSEVQRGLIARGIEPGFLNPEEFRKFALQQYDMFGTLMRELGLAR